MQRKCRYENEYDPEIPVVEDPATRRENPTWLDEQITKHIDKSVESYAVLTVMLNPADIKRALQPPKMDCGAILTEIQPGNAPTDKA